MDYDDDEGCGIRNIFRSFVCVALTLLLGLHVYSYLWGSQDTIEGDFGDIKYMVMQLTQGLSEVVCYSYFVNKSFYNNNQNNDLVT